MNKLYSDIIGKQADKSSPDQALLGGDIEKRIETFRDLVGRAAEHLHVNANGKAVQNQDESSDESDDCEVDSDRSFMDFFSSSAVHASGHVAGEDVQMDRVGRWGMRHVRETAKGLPLSKKPEKVKVVAPRDVHNWGVRF